MSRNGSEVNDACICILERNYDKEYVKTLSWRPRNRRITGLGCTKIRPTRPAPETMYCPIYIPRARPFTYSMISIPIPKLTGAI